MNYIIFREFISELGLLYAKEKTREILFRLAEMKKLITYCDQNIEGKNSPRQLNFIGMHSPKSKNRQLNLVGLQDMTVEEQLS